MKRPVLNNLTAADLLQSAYPLSPPPNWVHRSEGAVQYLATTEADLLDKPRLIRPYGSIEMELAQWETRQVALQLLYDAFGPAVRTLGDNSRFIFHPSYRFTPRIDRGRRTVVLRWERHSGHPLAIDPIDLSSVAGASNLAELLEAFNAYAYEKTRLGRT